MNTARNSSPFALCSVISVTWPPSSTSRSASWSEYSEISWRNPDSDGSCALSSYSRATPTSSSRFSSRPRASIVRSFSSCSRYPLRSSTASTICATDASVAVAISVSITLRKPCTARADAVATPASSTRPVASHSEMPCPSANVTMRAIDVSPMPRRGRFAIRISDTASNGLSIACRYAIASLISARS